MKKLTYISLFSSAGVGCFGFKQEGFECIATNELLPRRLEIQRVNNKCKYDTGYISGDITDTSTRKLLFDEISYWKVNEKIDEVDVVIATPPCQGMSVANHKKNESDIDRNSLVVYSINLVLEIRPKIFVFENVSAFLKTLCTDSNKGLRPIGDVIQDYLADFYEISSRVINFKQYGSNSSRTRTLVIGVRKDIAINIFPASLFPKRQKEKTLRDIIFSLERLSEFNQQSADILHFFRSYPPYMRKWISDLSEGHSAFENKDPRRFPKKYLDGNWVELKNKNSDKFKRQEWDKVAPCVHTRNDQLASQNTIHPVDDRVFSIRELMIMMTIPESFKWYSESDEYINRLSSSDRIKFIKDKEINIRQSIGEAVPTSIFQQIARNIRQSFSRTSEVTGRDIQEKTYHAKNQSSEDIIDLFKNNAFDSYFAAKLLENSNKNRISLSAYYTDKLLISSIDRYLPDFSKNSIRILEPSVGLGNFLPFLFSHYHSIDKVMLDVVDIDPEAISKLKIILDEIGVPSNFSINYIVDDFLSHDFSNKYDLIIGNPPFTKGSKLYKKYEHSISWPTNKKSRNLASFFMEKAVFLADHVSLIMPKNVLNTPEFDITRKIIRNLKIETIIDFGEKGFEGILIETICLVIDTKKKPGETNVISIPREVRLVKQQKYITDAKLPYYVIYRNEVFDMIWDSMVFGIFSVFRDRQITNKSLSRNGEFRVIKSRNISDDGSTIIDIPGYDAFFGGSVDELKKYSVYRYLDQDVYIAPNMTYKTRIGIKPKGTIVNGSVAILVPKQGITLSNSDLRYISSPEYREFMRIAQNYQTRTLNIDSNSVYFYGKRKG